MKICGVLVALLVLQPPLLGVAGELTTLEEGCKAGLFQMDSSEYSVMHYCEGALGNYIAVVMSGQWSESSSSAWTLDDRYWFDRTWGNDVTSYYYDGVSRTLWVATSGYYGRAGVYRIDVAGRKYEKCKASDEPEDTTEGRYTLQGTTDSEAYVQYTDPRGMVRLTTEVRAKGPCVLKRAQ